MLGLLSLDSVPGNSLRFPERVQIFQAGPIVEFLPGEGLRMGRNAAGDNGEEACRKVRGEVALLVRELSVSWGF